MRLRARSGHSYLTRLSYSKAHMLEKRVTMKSCLLFPSYDATTYTYKTDVLI